MEPVTTTTSQNQQSVHELWHVTFTFYPVLAVAAALVFGLIYIYKRRQRS